jgi:hypothetical protein
VYMCVSITMEELEEEQIGNTWESGSRLRTMVVDTIQDTSIPLNHLFEDHSFHCRTPTTIDDKGDIEVNFLS